MTTIRDIDQERRSRPGTNSGAQQTFRLRRPTINITPVERIGRVAIGLFAIIAGGLLLAGTGSAVAGMLEVLLILAGVDLAVTGALGHCPLYRKLGYVPASLRRSS